MISPGNVYYGDIMDKVSFEDACLVGKRIVTASNLKTIGVDTTMSIYKNELAKVGWTHEELMAESLNRTLNKIEELRGR